MKKSLSHKPTVVIAGGGFAGATIAQKLQSQCNVILIDQKPYFEFTPSTIRALVKPSKYTQIIQLYDSFLPHCHIVIDKILSIDETSVSTQHHTFSFDYLIISCGSSYPNVCKSPHSYPIERLDSFRSHFNKLKKSKHVLIVGGGPLGVELATDIKSYFPHIHVSLIESSPRLLSRCSQGASEYVQSYLKKQQIDLLLNQRVTSFKEHYCVTSKKERIPADLIFSCVGIQPNSTCLKGQLNKQLNAFKYLNVTDSLSVPGFPTIFAAGDIVNINEEKTAQNALKHAQVIIHNIKAHIKNKSLRSYTPGSTTPLIISLGKYNAILTYNNFYLTGPHISFMKYLVERSEMRKLN